MSRKKEIGPALAQLALQIATQASGDDVALDAKVDAFKALTSYHIGTTKVKAKDDPDEGGNVASFSNFKKRIGGAEGGRS